MTVAISKAVQEGATAVICASTGNTSASAAAYAAKAGLSTASSWCRTAGSRPASSRRRWSTTPGCCRSRAASTTACGWPATSPTATRSRWSTRSTPTASRGRRRRRSRSSTRSGRAPDVHCLPVGNAGNITAYWKGYVEYAADGLCDAAPDVGLPGRRRGAARPGRAGRRARDGRDRHPHRRPGVVDGAVDGARRLGGAHRRGDRRADPRRAAPAVRHARASSSSRPARRRWPGCCSATGRASSTPASWWSAR